MEMINSYMLSTSSHVEHFFYSWESFLMICFLLSSNGLKYFLVVFLYFHPSEIMKDYSSFESIAWKLKSTSGFPIWKIGGNYMETPGFQRVTCAKPQGNPGFPM